MVRVSWVSGFEGCGDHVFNSLIGFSHQVRSYRVVVSLVSKLSAQKLSIQFFFVSTVDGCAEVIISPAFLARLMRKSWISWRFGSAMVVRGKKSVIVIEENF